MNTNKNIKNDNNIYLFNLKNNKEKVAPFLEGDEVSQFLKTKGINSLEEYEKLELSEQDDLMEQYFFSNR